MVDAFGPITAFRSIVMMGCSDYRRAALNPQALRGRFGLAGFGAMPCEPDG